MTTTDTTDQPNRIAPADLVERYLAAWNSDDPDARRAAMAAAWTPGHHFTDPLADVRGYDELDGFIAGVRDHYPGSTFRLVSGIDAHHDLARWSWELVLSDGTVAAIGHDSVRLAEDGRIELFLGFFGPLPAAA